MGKNSYLNDEIRIAFINMAFDVVHEFDPLIAYLKLRGWMHVPPIYPNVPVDVYETLDLAAAAHLWEHVSFRYDNIWLTKLFNEMVHDADFKLVIGRGITTLEKQIDLLERQCKKYGVPLPKRLSSFVALSPATAETIGDDKIFRSILGGHQGALVMHSEAIKQTILNDSVRQIFRDLLIDELNNYNKFVKYGKLKNWVHAEPKYGAFVK